MNINNNFKINNYSNFYLFCKINIYFINKNSYNIKYY